MLLDLKFSIGTLGLAMGTFLAGLYGMNLENFIEETRWGFGAVTSLSVVFSIIVCWYGLLKLRKIRRIRMVGDEKGNLARSRPWFQEDGPLSLLEARNRQKLRRMNMQKAVSRGNWPGR
jgi:magnesium transporter